MDTDEKVEEVLELIGTLFPEASEKISTIGFVNWHNIVHHASLEGLDAKQVLFVANLVLALAAVNFDNTSSNTLTISDHLKQVSFDETLDFLTDDDEKDV